MGDNLAKNGFESQHLFEKFFIFFANFSEPPYFTRGSAKIKKLKISKNHKFLKNIFPIFPEFAVFERFLRKKWGKEKF